MNHDDADPDDAGLEGLRSMFRSLPDEEPPARGLDALMAAARVKANEMSEVQPSLWERFVAIMRRPQVLALATIMILIGGAVFISQRSDKLESAGPQVQQERNERALAPTPQAPADQTVTTGAVENEPTEGHAGSGPGAAPPAVTTPVEPSTEDRKTSTAKDPEPVSPAPKHGASKPSGSVAKAPTKPAPKAMKSAGRYDANDALSSDAFGGAGPGAAGPTAAQPTESAKEAAAPTVKQLHAQARAAAAKQDCATVKSLAKQIASKDAPYYRANIATDSALASCLN